MMIIGNAKAFINGVFRDTSVAIENGIIVGIDVPNMPADIDANGMYFVPGFVDIHTHGAVNEDFSDGNPEGLQRLSRYYASFGVTSFLATTMTLKEKSLTPAMEAVCVFTRPRDGAHCEGIHLEGPFLSYKKRGAQAAENLHKPDIHLFKRLNDSSGNNIRLVTVAPEEYGAMDFIREASKSCTVSLGHTTADYDTAMTAFESGASHVTHLFNGMHGFGHRAPGVVGAALDSGATVELICDGLHIHPAVVRATYKLFGKNVVAISDSLRCAGAPDGQYELGGQQIEVRQGKATLLGTETLAGSSTNLLDELRNLVHFGIPLEDAILSITEAPAKAIGLDHSIGSISVGKRADFLILDKNLNLVVTFIDGQLVNGSLK